MPATNPAPDFAANPTITGDPTTPTTLYDELERQISNLVARGYPAAAGVAEAEFRDGLAPLADRLEAVPASDGEPFVLVVPNVVAPDVAITQVKLRGKAGFTSMEADDLQRFRALDSVTLPESAYLLVDIDTGPDSLNVPPADAMPKILAAERTPLTIDEGISLATHFPEVPKTRNCFSILGSRCGDRRVPAIWLSRGRPRLGWCWEGAPHTWLGSASAAGRIGAAVAG